MAGQLLVEAQAMQEELVGWRRALHQIPEIGVKLPQTVAFVVSKLEEMGVDLDVKVDSVHIKGKKEKLKPVDIKTLPYPGFATDIQQPLTDVSHHIRQLYHLLSHLQQNQ